MLFVPIDGSFAQEVRDLPLWERVNPDNAVAIRDAFRESGLLVFRRQSLSETELL